MEKVERDGLVAVLYSPGFGAGWSTWQSDDEDGVLIFSPKLVYLVEQDRHGEITQELCAEILGLKKGAYVCSLGSEQLKIEWIAKGEEFEITEYDGFESVEELGKKSTFTA